MKTIILSIALLFAVSCKKNNNIQPDTPINPNQSSQVHTIKCESDVDDSTNFFMSINNVYKNPATNTYTVKTGDVILATGQNLQSVTELHIWIYQDGQLVKQVSGTPGCYTTYTVN